MKSADHFDSIYLCRDFVDMRKSINGLSQIVESEMELSPFEKCLFVFTNRRKKIIKALYWFNTGFALWMLKLEQDKFSWPVTADSSVVTLTYQQFNWLIEGYNLAAMKPHETLSYSRFS